MPMHRVASLADLRRDRGLQVDVGEKKIVLVRDGEEVRAYQGECPHAGRRWPMARCATAV